MHDLLHDFLHELLHSLEFLIGHDGVHMLEDFLHEFLELAVMFFGINFMVQLILQKVSKERLHSLLGGKKSYAAAALLGAATPYCTCATVPVVKGMVNAGVNFGAVMVFLFTSPLISPIVISLLFSLLGLKITVIYMLSSLGVAFVSAYLLEKYGFEKYIIGRERASTASQSVSAEPPYTAMAKENTESPQSEINKPLFQDSVIAIRTNSLLQDTASALKASAKELKYLMPFIVIASLLSMFVHDIMPTDFISRYIGSENLLGVPIAAMAGIPF